ncbi:MAG: hypothetical protein JWN14_1922 [Chthonomonadales bacterium]|nr:hypothetical protein [Chthonomonadales bacterium]
MRQDASAPRHNAAPFGLLTSLFALLCLCGTVRAAHADITLDTLVGFGQNAVSGSRYRPDTWTPITIYVGGQGMRGTGQLQLLVRQGAHTTNYTRRISLHDGPLNEVVNFTVQLDSPLRNGGSTGLNIQAQLLVDGRKVAEKRAPLPLGVQEESFNILALTKDGSGMNFLIKKRLGLFHGYFNPLNLISRNNINVAETSEYEKVNTLANSTLMYTLAPAMPASAQGYDMVDVVALADMPLDNLTEDQLEALKGYVRNGGTLILSGGTDLSRLKSGFYNEMLPLDQISVRPVRDLNLLAQRYKEPLPLPNPIGLVTGTMKPGTQALFGDLVYSRPYGNGVVLLTTFDFLDPNIRSWKEAPSLWRDLLRSNPTRISPRRTLASNARNGETGMQPLADAMAGKQATNAPPMLVVTIFLAAYLILLVPVSYFILKKIDKRELAWFTSPALILGFTVISYLIALSIKGGALTVNRAVVLETVAGSDQVSGYGQLTLYSPRRAAYDISMAPTGDANSPYRTLIPSEVLSSGSVISGDLTVDMDNTAMLRGAEVRLWDKRSFETPVAANLGGAVEAKTRMIDHQNVEVTITNKTRYTLQDCVVLNGGQANVIGDLAPGATKKQTLKWSYKDFGSGLTLPNASQNQAPTPDSQDVTQETPERTQLRLRNGLTSALFPQNNNGYNYYNGETEQAYGRSTNAVIGWFSDPLLKVQVDGKEAGGLEANMLMVHLPAPANATPEIRKAMNPFLQEPIYNILEDVPGATRPNGNRMGIYR